MKDVWIGPILSMIKEMAKNEEKKIDLEQPGDILPITSGPMTFLWGVKVMQDIRCIPEDRHKLVFIEADDKSKIKGFNYISSL